jgi:hypothetical protein
MRVPYLNGFVTQYLGHSRNVTPNLVDGVKIEDLPPDNSQPLQIS